MALEKLTVEEKNKLMEEFKARSKETVKYLWATKIVTNKSFEECYSQLPYISLGQVMGTGADGSPKPKGVRVAFKFILNGKELGDMCRIATEEEVEKIEKIVSNENYNTL